ncbi:hypothetical protein GGX14DRAFT_554105 [Mycena pura]|uniref:Uncharacterized protein n=1 Tax=Mycena pura TaxID=153505 RepID=A0AAD6YVM3_9AGAR|nr:hypothetical protein GGX14DRAFT_554105 [Mycena pura]
MSHNLRERAAAHVRHANRAGGFGDGLPFSFPPGPQPTFSFPDPPARPTRTQTIAQPSFPLSFPLSLDTGLPSIPALPSSPISLVQKSSTPSPSLTHSTLSSSSTTTTTPTSLPVTTTYTGTALHNNLSQTKYVTQFATASVKAAAASSSSSNVPTTSNALVAPVIGGVAGGILGLAVLMFLITFCIRRRRKRDEAIDFDPGIFRRSAVMLDDPPTHQDTVARGYNPPTPPAMMENRQLYASQPNYPLSPGLTPTSGNPLVFEAPFSPISPGMTSPVSAYDNGYGAPTMNVPVLTRNLSASSASSAHAPAQYAQYPAVPASRNSGPQNEEYLDLERTSVTPFQAAQYAEISKQLNTEVPKGLDTPAVNQFVMDKMPIKDAELPPLPTQDPFVDAATREEEDANEEDEATLPKVQDLSFPAPPSPVATSASRYRIDSMPPSLPEIIVQPRVSVSTYMSEGSSPSASMAGFPSGQTVFLKSSPFAESPINSRFPVTPSPLANSFTIRTPPAAQSGFRTAGQPGTDVKDRRSVYTVYDPEDAYGGI